MSLGARLACGGATWMSLGSTLALGWEKVLFDFGLVVVGATDAYTLLQERNLTLVGAASEPL